MLILLSPAKTLDYESPVKTKIASTPQLLEKSAEIAAVLKKKSPKQLGKLMGVSDSLAELNHQRYQEWRLPIEPSQARQAILAFKGDVYLGLQADKLTEKQLEYAQDHLRVLSGLYGVLRPLDLILPYRLEMGTALKVKRKKDLYAFWADTITETLNGDLESNNCETVVNLASNEYFKSIQTTTLNAQVISPAFKDWSNGNYKVLSFFAKKARGTMASWMVRKKVKTTKRLQQFAEDGYRFDPDSSTETKPVFLRRQD